MSLVFRIDVHDVLDSTNTAVKHAIDAGEGEGLAVQAARQTAGYGRLGHSWDSPDGGLYLSLLLRPAVSDEVLATLPLVAGAAVLEACALLAARATEANAAEDTGETVAFALKWPNDVLAVSGDGSRPETVKIAGISCEKYRGAVCLGIGVDAADLPCNPTPSPDDVRDAVLVAFADAYGIWLAGGFAPFAEEVSARNILAGRMVEVQDARGQVRCRGVAQSVDTGGRLVLRDGGGALVRVSSGEAHIAW